MAIAVLMNDALQNQDVWVKVTVDDRCLQVMLKGRTALYQPHCVEFIRRGLLRLQSEAIKQVVAYGWQIGDTFPLWIASFDLEQPSSASNLLQSQSSAATESSSDRLVDHTSVQPVRNALPNEVAAQPPKGRLASPSKPIRQRSELFKLGVVIVLTTAVYFMVTGV